MVSIPQLWLPILVATIAVFIVSSVIHTVLSYHHSDFGRLPNENEVMQAIGTEIPPGGYMFPHSKSPAEMGTPEMVERYKKGPIGVLNVLPKGPPVMAKHLILWFAFCLGMGVFLAYLAGRTLAPDTSYLQVFRFVGTAGFLGYGFGGLADSIWKGQAWSVTFKNLFDGLLYALTTAGVFGWLWPN